MWSCGLSIALIDDIPPCSELLETMVEEVGSISFSLLIATVGLVLDLFSLVFFFVLFFNLWSFSLLVSYYATCLKNIPAITFCLLVCQLPPLSFQ